MIPAYQARLRRGELRQRSEELQALTEECTLCPRECRAHRRAGDLGVCAIADVAYVSSAASHFGEEPPLVGEHGSGTIFFSSCNLRCVFCQNHSISWSRHGSPVSSGELASQMIGLQEAGCHNINLVTPTHVTPQIVAALALAAERGLKIPLVYNCGGYESVTTLRLLHDVVDIYMPDIKYSDSATALTCSGVPHYWETVRTAVAEMHRQVGDLWIDARGIAQRGLLVRHLVLPADLAGTEGVLAFLRREISVNTYVNIMDQYRPQHRAVGHPSLGRPVTGAEVTAARRCAERLGLHRGFAPADCLPPG